MTFSWSKKKDLSINLFFIDEKGPMGMIADNLIGGNPNGGFGMNFGGGFGSGGYGYPPYGGGGPYGSSYGYGYF